MNFPLTPTDKIGGAADEIKGLTWRFKLHDIWRDQHTNKTQFTWRNNSLKVQCRLDYWLVSTELLMSFIDTNITNPTISDHSAITFFFNRKTTLNVDLGFGKINDAFLKDANFIDELVSKIPKYKSKHCYLANEGLY